MSNEASASAPSGHDDPSKEPAGPLTELTQVASALAVIVAIAYGCGFVIVSTFLSQYGVFEADFVKPAYLTIGAIFLMANGVFWVVAGRRVWTLNESRDEILALQKGAGKSGGVWQFASINLPIIELIFGLCVTVIGCELVLSPAPDYMLKVALFGYAIGAALYFQCSVSAARVFITPFTLLYLATLQLVVCAVTVVYAGAVGRGLGIIFWNALIGALLIYVITKARGVDRPLIMYLVGVYGIVGSAAFGLFVYPYVGIAFGGGATQPVQVVLKGDSLPAYLEAVFRVRQRTIRDARVISEGTASLVIAWPADAPADRANVLRLDKSLVTAIITGASPGISEAK